MSSETYKFIYKYRIGVLKAFMIESCVCRSQRTQGKGEAGRIISQQQSLDREHVNKQVAGRYNEVNKGNVMENEVYAWLYS